MPGSLPIASLPTLILASASPRRRELLASVGLVFAVAPTEVDESSRADEEPIDYVIRVADAKCRAAADAKIDRASEEEEVIVVAADTTVEIDRAILGKPSSGVEAAAMLRALSGRTHRVHTAVAAMSIAAGVIADKAEAQVTTAVTFARLSDDEIDWYVGLGESLDKAGGYGIQSAGAALIERIEGSPSNVIGLPVRETLQIIAHLQKLRSTDSVAVIGNYTVA